MNAIQQLLARATAGGGEAEKTSTDVSDLLKKAASAAPAPPVDKAAEMAENLKRAASKAKALDAEEPEAPSLPDDYVDDGPAVPEPPPASQPAAEPATPASTVQQSAASSMMPRRTIPPTPPQAGGFVEKADRAPSFPEFSSNGTHWIGREWMTFFEIDYGPEDGQELMGLTSKLMRIEIRGIRLEAVNESIMLKKMFRISPSPPAARRDKSKPFIETVAIIRLNEDEA